MHKNTTPDKKKKNKSCRSTDIQKFTIYPLFSKTALKNKIKLKKVLNSKDF